MKNEFYKLTKEQQKDAEKRAKLAQSEFLNQFKGVIADKVEDEPVKCDSGIKTGSLKVKAKSAREIEDSRQRQLAMIKGKL